MGGTVLSPVKGLRMAPELLGLVAGPGGDWIADAAERILVSRKGNLEWIVNTRAERQRI